MKKEKERNLTLEQLEKRMNIASKISSTSVILIFLGVIALFFIVGITKNSTKEFKGIVIGMYFMIGFLLYIIAYTALTIRDKYKQKINTIKKQKKAEEMRQLSQNGNLKDFVEIKSEKMKMDILSHGIEKIEIEDFIDKEFSVKVQLKGDKEIFMITTVSKEELISLLQDEEKQEILGRLIHIIEVNKTINEDGNKLNKLRISTLKYQYHQGDITDCELLEMLEIKK